MVWYVAGRWWWSHPHTLPCSDAETMHSLFSTSSKLSSLQQHLQPSTCNFHLPLLTLLHTCRLTPFPNRLRLINILLAMLGLPSVCWPATSLVCCTCVACVFIFLPVCVCVCVFTHVANNILTEQLKQFSCLVRARRLQIGGGGKRKPISSRAFTRTQVLERSLLRFCLPCHLPRQTVPHRTGSGLSSVSSPALPSLHATTTTLTMSLSPFLTCLTSHPLTSISLTYFS